VRRAVTSENGGKFLGSGGFTVTHTGTGTYHVSFPVGFWNKLSTSCGLVPQVDGLWNGTTARPYGWTVYGAGSSEMGVVTTSGGQGADAAWTLVATSGAC
jgi:hypothetical protein